MLNPVEKAAVWIVLLGSLLGGCAAPTAEDGNRETSAPTESASPPVRAQAMSALEKQAYKVGWDFAATFCASLDGIAPNYSGVTVQFSAACKQGFDDHVNANKHCQEAMATVPDGYKAMWSARSRCD